MPPTTVSTEARAEGHSVRLAPVLACALCLSCAGVVLRGTLLYTRPADQTADYAPGRRYVCDRFSVFIPEEDRWQVIDSCSAAGRFVQLAMVQGNAYVASILIAADAAGLGAPASATHYLDGHLRRMGGEPPVADENVSLAMLETLCAEAASGEVRKPFMIVLAPGTVAASDPKAAKAGRLASSLATMLALNMFSPATGVIALPNPLTFADGAAGAAARRKPRALYGVSSVRVCTTDASAAAVHATLLSHKVDGAQLHFFRYLLRSIRTRCIPERPEEPYTPYEQVRTAIVLTSGHRGAGLIERIDSTFVHYRKAKGAEPIRLRREDVRMLIDGDDTTWIQPASR